MSEKPTITDVLRGYELAMKNNSERLNDLVRIYRVLNDGHIDTQTNLAALTESHKAVRAQVERDSIKLSALDDEFNEFKTSAMTLFSIVKWIITPAVLLNLLAQFFIWYAGNVN